MKLTEHKWLLPTGPHFRTRSQTWPQLGISSKQDVLEFSSNFFLPHGHVLTTSGVRRQLSQFSTLRSWQILEHWWFPQSKLRSQVLPHEYTYSTFSTHSTILSLGWLHWHFWITCTWQGLQAPKWIKRKNHLNKAKSNWKNVKIQLKIPLWHISWQVCILQFKRAPQILLQIGNVPHLPVWLVFPHGHVLENVKKIVETKVMYFSIRVVLTVKH